MATNLQIDDSLIEKAVQLGGHRTKKSAGATALTGYVHHREQEKILTLLGSIDYDPKYNYKKQRRLR